MPTAVQHTYHGIGVDAELRDCKAHKQLQQLVPHKQLRRVERDVLGSVVVRGDKDIVQSLTATTNR